MFKKQQSNRIVIRNSRNDVVVLTSRNMATLVLLMALLSRDCMASLWLLQQGMQSCRNDTYCRNISPKKQNEEKRMNGRQNGCTVFLIYNPFNIFIGYRVIPIFCCGFQWSILSPKLSNNCKLKFLIASTLPKIVLISSSVNGLSFVSFRKYQKGEGVKSNGIDG